MSALMGRGRGMTQGQEVVEVQEGHPVETVRSSAREQAS